MLETAKPGRTREQTTKECQDFFEQGVCVSELANWQCEAPELHIASKVVSG